MSVITAIPSTRFHVAGADAESARSPDNALASGTSLNRSELTGSTSMAGAVPSGGLHPAVAERAEATIFSMLDSMVKHPVSHELPDRTRAAGKAGEIPQELLEVVGGIAAAVAGVAVAFSAGPVAASALPAVACSMGPVAASALPAAASSTGLGAVAEAMAPSTGIAVTASGPPSSLAPNGGLHPVAQNPGTRLRTSSDYDTWDNVCAFFRDDNGVGDLSEDLGKESAEL